MADLKLSHLSPGIKKKPTTTASFSLVWASWQVSDDEDDAEDGDVQMCVCRVKVSVFFLCVVGLKLRVCVYIQHIRPLLAVFFFLTPPPVALCVNENSQLYLERADVTSALSREPITVAVVGVTG